jgi:hypothetical protein
MAQIDSNLAKKERMLLLFVCGTSKIDGQYLTLDNPKLETQAKELEDPRQSLLKLR